MAKAKTKAKVEDPKPNDGFLYYVMDQHMWIFTIFLVPISLIYDIYFKVYLMINLWKDRQKVGKNSKNKLRDHWTLKGVHITKETFAGYEKKFDDISIENKLSLNSVHFFGITYRVIKGCQTLNDNPNPTIVKTQSSLLRISPWRSSLNDDKVVKWEMARILWRLYWGLTDIKRDDGG